MIIKSCFKKSVLQCQSRFFSSGVVRSPYRDVELSEVPYFQFVFQHLEYHKKRTAIVDGITHRSLSYGELVEGASRFATALQSMPDQCKTLGIFLPNCIDYPLVFSGAARANVTTTTLNPAYTPREISKQLSLSNVSHLVTDSEHLPIIEETKKQVENPIQVILTDEECSTQNHLSLQQLVKEHDISGSSKVGINVHKDIVTMPFSSGTTGLPKGVMLTHFNLVSNLIQMLGAHPDISIMEESNDLSPNVLLSVLPMYHIYAMHVSMGNALRTGTTIVSLPKFEPKSYTEALQRYRPTILHLAPPLVNFLVTNSDVKSWHLDSVKDVLSAAAPLGPALYEQFKTKFPNTVLREVWGMSETSPLATITPKSKVKVGSCGVAVPNAQIKIVDVETGNNLPPMKTGELCVAGPMNMKGYLNNKKATDETVKDGWLHSGDIAYYDEDGYVFIVDRIKELIKVKGYQVSPTELEDLIRTMDGVKDVAVIGIPHSKYGEVPRAYIVRLAASELSALSPNVSEESVKEFVSENVTSYKQLAGGVEFIEAIPKSAAGKILRRVLTQEFKNRGK